ncbi:MAG: hypothetical protein ACXWBN_17920 [Acidimicrobiales bacterium]
MRPVLLDSTTHPTGASRGRSLLPAESIVGIDPGKVLTLAGALGRASDRAVQLAGAIAGVLTAAGQDADLVRPLHAFAVWCEVERPAVRVAAETILAFEAGPVASWFADLGIHHSPPLAELADPVAAVDAAAEAVAAIESHDDRGFADLVDRWGADAVFAAVLVDRLGAGVIGAEVDHLAALTGSGLDDERRLHEQVVAGLATALATARRTGGADLSVADLVAGLRGRPAGELALLFLGPVVFDDDFLVDAVDQLVEALVGVAVDDGVWVAAAPVDGERDARDSTTLVLRALARRPSAATQVLVDADLQRLLVDTPYRDGGTALAAVLDVGTDPSRDDPRAPQAALGVITWVADHVVLDHGDLAQAPRLGANAQAGLGLVAAHYIGSFRSDHHDGIEVDPVSDQLRAQISGQQADRFLVFAAREQDAADVMRAALVDWAAAGVARLDPLVPVDQQVFTVIGDVGRRVSDAVQVASVSWATRADRRRDGERYVWDRVSTAVSNAVEGWDPTNMVVSMLGQRVIDQFMPGTHVALDVATRGSRSQSGDQLRLEQVALGVLWARRGDNHLFDQAPPPPELLDGTRLRTVVEVEQAGAVERFDEWLATLAGQGVGPLDRLGAEFGSTGARSSD